jgi:hypothetical protein
LLEENARQRAELDRLTIEVEKLRATFEQELAKIRVDLEAVRLDAVALRKQLSWASEENQKTSVGLLERIEALSKMRH